MAEPAHGPSYADLQREVEGLKSLHELHDEEVEQLERLLAEERQEHQATLALAAKGREELAEAEEAARVHYERFCARESYARTVAQACEEIAGCLEYFHNEGERPDEWLLKEWAMKLRAALAKNPAEDESTTRILDEAAREGFCSSRDSLAVNSAPVEFHVWCQMGEDDTEFVAQVDGPRDMALSEARRYAAGAATVGATVFIEEVTRREVERLSPVTGAAS